MKIMNRRELLKSGGVALATSTLPLPEATSVQVKASVPFTVPADEGRPGGLWFVHGEKTFFTKVSGADVGHRYAIIEAHTPPGLGPELHTHLHQNELFFVLKGSIGVQCGSERTVLRTGDAFMAPANTPHAFVALGTEPAHTLFLFDPAGDMEAFFADYAPIISVDGEPDRQKLVEVNAKHGIKVVGPPLSAGSFAS
jgi:quercetin dioxygenase-like cupin family protein